MLAVEIDLLTGRYTATRHDDRQEVEWPPHPGRLFAAMVAVWAAEEIPRDEERRCLYWLEAQSPPQLAAGPVATRLTQKHYVPINDVAAVEDYSKDYRTLIEASEAGSRSTAVAENGPTGAQRDRAIASSKKAATAPRANVKSLLVMPDHRTRHERTYPTVRPESPLVHVIWPDADPDDGTREAIDGLLRRVWRLGHSSTLVACRVVDGAVPNPTFGPADTGEHHIRVPVPGQLDALERAHTQHQQSEPRALPSVSRRYRHLGETVPVPAPVPLLGGEWIVLEQVDGPGVPLPVALDVARAVRAALLSHADDPSPELLSGHTPGAVGARTAPSARAHLAVVPLPFVGHRHADGRSTGVALVLPAEVTSTEREALLRALARWRDTHSRYRLTPTGGRTRHFRLSDLVDPPVTLRRSRWCGSASRWATVTPVALDRFPGDLTSRDPERAADAAAAATESIATACEHAGLPRPVGVEVSRAPMVTGSRPVRAFPAFRTASGVTRASVHAEILFADAVEGPVLLGAGRFLGRGLCLPVDGGHRG